MNSIEQFINNNRDEFDSEEMKSGWEKIEPGIKQKKTSLVKMKRFWYAAAAAVVISVSGAVYFTNMNHQDKNNNTALQLPVDVPSREITDQVDPGYAMQMDQFAQLIALKQNELSQNQKRQPVLYEQFLKDNNQLDSSYTYLKSKLAANPNKEILLDAMIQNLQLKLDLLNKQLQIIKQSKHKKTDNEKTI